jgi:CRP/FNR family transcriptional regulator, cyclic AMP receptor protein
MRVATRSRIRSESRFRSHGAVTGTLQDRLRMLRGSGLFTDVPADALEKVALTMKERNAAPNEAIFLQADEGTTIFGILVGEVRIVISSVDGRDQVLRVLSPGEMFGEISALDRRGRTAGAIAVTRCRLLLLERSSLFALIESQPAVAFALIGSLCERIRCITSQVEALLFHTFSERLASALLGLRKGDTSASINVTQTELSQLTGVTRESVNKKLRNWQSAGIVELQPGRIRVLDAEELQRMLAPPYHDEKNNNLRSINLRY